MHPSDMPLKDICERMGDLAERLAEDCKPRPFVSD